MADPPAAAPDPAAAMDQWLDAVRSLGIHPQAGDVLPAEAKAALVARRQAFMEAGDYESALDPAWLLAYDDPMDRDHALEFALCLQHLGDMASACRFYSAALLMEPTDAYCLYRLGECLQSLGDLEEARSLFAAAIDLCRDETGYAEVREQARLRLDESAGEGAQP